MKTCKVCGCNERDHGIALKPKPLCPDMKAFQICYECDGERIQIFE